MKKVVFFAFQGEEMCFTHILFNALDMHKKGIDTHIVIEGAATKLVKTMIEKENPLFLQVTELDLIDSVCMACSRQMGVYDFINDETDFKLGDELLGHPPIEPYIAKGYQVITL